MKILYLNLILTLNPHRFCLFLLKDFNKSSRVVFSKFYDRFLLSDTHSGEKHYQALKTQNNQVKILTLTLILSIKRRRVFFFVYPLGFS